MICKSLNYIAVICFAVTTPRRCTTEQLPPPRNLSYVWIDDFYINLTWQANPVSHNCSVGYMLQIPNRSAITISPRKRMSKRLLMVGSDLSYTVKTTNTDQTLPCQHYEDSEKVSIVIRRQVPLVTDFKFFLHPRCDDKSTRQPFCGMQATWRLASGTSGLQVSYRSCSAPASLLRCQDNGELGRRCHLAGLKQNEDVCIVFRGTVDDRAQVYTLKVNPIYNIRTPPPDVRVSEQGHHLNVSWRHSIVCPKSSWQYRVNYTECSRPNEQKSAYGGDSVLVPFKKDCRYEIQVKPLLNKACGLEFGDISALLVYNDGATRDQTMVVAVVVIPSVLSVLVVLVCCQVRRKRKTIFKNIPAPPSALKEMMSSLHQSQQQQLFVPAQEKVEVCRVSPATVEANPLLWKIT